MVRIYIVHFFLPHDTFRSLPPVFTSNVIRQSRVCGSWQCLHKFGSRPPTQTPVQVLQGLLMILLALPRVVGTCICAPISHIF